LSLGAGLALSRGWPPVKTDKGEKEKRSQISIIPL
jgi:hypothetical protein